MKCADIESGESLQGKQVARILTSDFPAYFVLVTRYRIEMTEIGTEGGSLFSTLAHLAHPMYTIVPKEALIKRIRLGIQAVHVPQEVLTRLGVAHIECSAVTTVEPRRRKFHKPITISIPVSKVYRNDALNQEPIDAQSLRLLCSITG